MPAGIVAKASSQMSRASGFAARSADRKLEKNTRAMRARSARK